MWSFEFFSKLGVTSVPLHSSSHQTVEILLVESSRERASISIVYYSIYTSKWCWDVLSSWSCLWGIWTRAYTTSRASSALELQQSSNNCHSHSGFSRMSRQKAWRTCQRPQGFDSCMHKTLARFRSQQDTTALAGISLVVESQIGTSTSTRTKLRERDSGAAEERWGEFYFQRASTIAFPPALKNAILTRTWCNKMLNLLYPG